MTLLFLSRLEAPDRHLGWVILWVLGNIYAFMHGAMIGPSLENEMIEVQETLIAGQGPPGASIYWKPLLINLRRHSALTDLPCC